MSNICWDCEHNTLKMKILVPHSKTIREYVQRTGSFQSDLIGVDKVSQGEYLAWFRSDGKIRLIAFNLLHLCALKIDRHKMQTTCSCFKKNEEKNSIKNIVYSKLTTADPIKPTIAPEVYL